MKTTEKILQIKVTYLESGMVKLEQYDKEFTPFELLGILSHVKNEVECELLRLHKPIEEVLDLTKDKLTTNVHSEQVAQPGAKHLLSAVASIEQIEEVARQYFEVKYPLMNLTNDDDNDKCEIDWWDMLQFAQHVLSCHCR